MRPTLHLITPQTQGGAFRREFTRQAPDWLRTTSRVGGYMTASFTLDPTQTSPDEMGQWFQTALGATVRETLAGLITWEGYIAQLRYVVDGCEYVRSLAPEWFHNRVKVVYSDNIGSRANTGWAEDTASIARYGRMEYIQSLGGATAASATALRDRRLTEFAVPRSRLLGAQSGRGLATQTLYAACLGYWHTLNWRYRETSATAAASTQISTLVGESEFVTAGQIETNTLSTYFKAVPQAQRLGDLIAEITAQGDAAGHIWQVGVYGERRLRYEQAPDAVIYHLRDGRLLNILGGAVEPAMVQPGALLRVGLLQLGMQPTSDVWSDPTVGYIDETEYSFQEGLSLRLYGEEESVAVKEQRLRAREVERQEQGSAT